MTLSTWLSLFTLCLMGAIFPGASLAVVLRNTLNHSRLHGAITGIAHAIGLGCYALLSVLGLVLVLQQSPLLFKTLSYFGAIYLLWLGYQGITATATPPAADMPNTPQPSATLWNAARDGLLIALLNPKVGLYFLAIFSPFINATMSLTDKAIFVSTITFVDGSWYVLVATALSQGNTLIWLKRHQQWIERALGCLLIVLALHIFLST
ncbi:Threonine/homoserine/homoserine lactone efflux protein [Thiothrix caldifontis]|uniref:Threonine/homoserine/homoserine lactone efflux protein n=1 Tax=Thiothrix caldifontis TaxID=525918 RepID=A0A1H3VKW5_9GAMM|nr:LysE family translocator [Thiothrix caldifontis]SDZ74752.1 Threonine/homoserine/homoserine lactone efflux protein [Thiothrix caldifontis]